MQARTILLALIASTPLTAQTEDIRALVYRLADPRGLLLTKEKLFNLGPKSVPHLLAALNDHDFKHGNHSWTDINRNPALADKSGKEIIEAAIGAVLHVLQELGPDARGALDGLLAITLRAPRRWQEFTSRQWTFGHAVEDAAVRIAMLTDSREQLLGHFEFQSRRVLQYDAEVTNDRLLEDLIRGRRSVWKRDACVVLRRRAKAIIADSRRCRRVVVELIHVLGATQPSPNIWPSLQPRAFRGNQKVYDETLRHDLASLVLANLDPRHPLAMRGHMIRLSEIRSKTRHDAALQLGQHGAKSAPATYCLIARLSDPVPVVQKAAIASLGFIGPDAKAAIPHLRTLALGEDAPLAAMARATLRHVDPEPTDTWTYYHHNGKVQAQGRCDGLTKVGRWSYWYFDGTKRWVGEYRDGKMHGNWTYWANGRSRVIEYESGKQVSTARK